MKNIQIVRVSPNDVTGIQNLLKESSIKMYLLAGYLESDIEDKFKDFLSPENILKTADSINNLSENDIYLVAKEGDKVVGLCYMQKEESKNILHALYILPEFQNKGVGKKLWNEAGRFIDKNLDTALEVFTTNTPAINFYKKLGFVDAGKRWIEERFKSKSGVEVEQMEMVLKF